MSVQHAPALSKITCCVCLSWIVVLGFIFGVSYGPAPNNIGLSLFIKLGVTGFMILSLIVIWVCRYIDLRRERDPSFEPAFLIGCDCDCDKMIAPGPQNAANNKALGITST